MSYRTYIENSQIFGNHERYPKWFAFLKTQGIEPDEDGQYEGDITDVMGMILVLEEIVCDIEKDRRERIDSLIAKCENTKTYSEMKKIRNHTACSIFSFEDTYFTLLHQDKNEKFGTSLLDELIKYTENGYMFLPY